MTTIEDAVEVNADAMLAEYVEAKARLTQVERALEIQKAKVHKITFEILETLGKGPHDLGDGKEGGYSITVRGDTCFFAPIRKNKAKGEASEE